MSDMPAAQGRVINLDVGAPQSDAAVHAAIKAAIGRTYTAGWYGLVWCLEEYPTPVTINVVGLDLFRARSPIQAKMFSIAMRDVVELRGGAGFVVHFA